MFCVACCTTTKVCTGDLLPPGGIVFFYDILPSPFKKRITPSLDFA